MTRAGMARLGHLAYMIFSAFFAAVPKFWLQPMKLLNLVDHTLMVMTALGPALFAHISSSCSWRPSFAS
jgi:ABC-type branched-subunit amino acid transport system permease subunit